jgi:putative ABC transport system ATP-binding protein
MALSKIDTNKTLVKSVSSSMIINTNELGKEYKAFDVNTVALEGISIRIRRGEFVAIMGPSGCGKSTLLNIIGLLDRPSTGELFFMGKDVSLLRRRELTYLRRKNIGFVFQNFNLIDELSVYQNIELPLLYLDIPKKERYKRVNAIMEEMEIAHKQKFFPQHLSGGQQQRVAVCRAVVSEPALILADEPTGNLDSTHGSDVMNLLSRFNEQGTTVIMVTHSPSDAEFSQRIIHLFDGHVVTDTLI